MMDSITLHFGNVEIVGYGFFGSISAVALFGLGIIATVHGAICIVKFAAKYF